MYTEKYLRGLSTVLFSLVLLVSAPPSVAQEETLLTIEITSEATGDTEVKELSYEDLAALPAVTVETTTNWTAGTQVFTGVPLLTLLESHGVSGGDGEIEMTAINDYSIFFDLSDPTNEGAVVAYLRNGEPMTAREKGPLWVVYDFDSNVVYRTETIYSRSIWQLDRMVISR